MAYEMRRTKQQLEQKEIKKILTHASNGVFALAPQNTEDFPYAVPVSFVYLNDAIYFHSALTGHKVDAIAACEDYGTRGLRCYKCEYCKGWHLTSHSYEN